MDNLGLFTICGLILLGSLDLVATQLCEEGSYVTADGQRRSLSTVFDELVDTPICDEGIDEDKWLRFYSMTGKLVERAAGNPVPMHHCGTDAPIYILGLDSHPLTDHAQTNAIVCANYGDDPCNWRDTIQIYRCPAQGDASHYYLYKLKSPPGCSIAYCVGGRTSCPRGEQWNGISCVSAFPAMSGRPQFSGPYLNGSGLEEEIYFKCEVQYDRRPNDANARFRVTFLFDGQPLEHIGQDAHSPPAHLLPKVLEPDRELTAILTEHYLRGRLGREISCQAESYWVGESKNISKLFSSAKYHAAFESTVQSSSISLLNGPIHNVTFRSTLPFTCSHCRSKPSTCCNQYRFRMRNHTASSQYCYLFWASGGDTAVMAVYFVPTTTQTKHSFALVFEPFNDDETTKRRSLWRDYVIPPVLMTTEPPSTPYMKCLSYIDPHIITFDKVFFGNPMVGDFYLVKATNPTQLMEVQVRHEVCFDGRFTCNCGVVVREGNSAFKISVCEGGQWSLTNQRRPTVVRLLSQNPADSSTVFMEQTGLSYSVRMPSGLRVEIYARSPWFNVEVHLPPEYHGKTDSASMCGNSNRYKNDDSTHSPHFRIPDNLSYLRRQPGCSHIFNAAATRCGCNDTKTARCSNTDPTLTIVSKSNNQYSGRASTGVECIKNPNQRRRRDAVETPQQHDSNNNENDFILDYETVFPPYTYDPNFGANASFTWPTPTGKTEQEVQRYCSDVLQSSPAYADCSSNADLTTIIAMCTSDIQIADDWISVSAYASLFEQECLINIVSSINSSETSNSNAAIEALSSVSAKICPNQCSGQGTCSAGSCTCNTGYIGADCSIDQAQPPSLTGILRGGLCDVHTRPCDVISVFGSGVAFSSQMKCRFTDQDNGAYAETDGLFITALEYSCPVPETTTHRRRRSATTRTTALSTKTVSITIDGVSYSNGITFVLFNSVCMECSGNQVCRQTNNSCLIDGACFASGAVNPDNDCLQCVPIVSSNCWINVTVVEDWSSCTRNCDVGIATKNTVCGYKVKNREFRFCKVLDCPGNSEQTTQGFGITLASENLTKILSEPVKFVNVITDALNSYCSTNASECCLSVGISSTNATSVTYTSPNLTSYASGYPIITASNAHMKVIVKIDEDRLRADCIGTQSSSSSIVYAQPKTIYEVIAGAKTDIENELEVAIESVWSSESVTMSPVTDPLSTKAITMKIVTSESALPMPFTSKSFPPQHVTSEYKTSEPVTPQTLTTKAVILEPVIQTSVASGPIIPKPVTAGPKPDASTASAKSSLMLTPLGIYLLLKGF